MRSVAGLVAVSLALPVLAARAWSTAYADRLAVAVATRLVAAVPLFSPPSNEPAAGFDDGSFSLASSSSPSPERSTPSPTAKGRAAHARPGTVAHGVRISASQVLALAARRAMPDAVPVKATSEHPAGLMLRSVSALGVGLQDGDVLTEAAGQKASSVAAVVGIVLAARGRQVPEISGRFYRGWVPFGLSVEQPYPKAPVPG